jgi:hypothetical protein
LDELTECSYDSFLVYDNVGLLLTTGRLSNRHFVSDLTDYVRAKPFCYWDLAVFASEDNDLFETVALAEGSRRKSIAVRR